MGSIERIDQGGRCFFFFFWKTIDCEFLETLLVSLWLLDEAFA